MNIDHTYTYAAYAFDEKPSNRWAGRISEDLTQQQTIKNQGDFNEFIDAIVNKGMPWAPSVFDGQRNNNNWQSSSILALDFDTGISSQRAVKRIEDLGVTPNIIYYTFSHKENHHKFRMIFFLDMVIKKRPVWEYFIEGLMAIFPEADKACKDFSRYYYGGKDGYVRSKTEVDSGLLESIIDAHIITQSSGRTYKIQNNSLSGNGLTPVKSPLRKTGAAISNNRSTRFSQTYKSPLRKKGAAISNNRSTRFSQGYKKWLLNRKENSFDFEKTAGRVKIFRDFLNGAWLRYPEIFGLATSLHYAKGGLKLMKQTMQEWTDDPTVKTHYDSNAYNALKSVRKKSYVPQKLKNFSPYRSDWNHKNLILAERDGIRGVKYEPVQRMSLKQAENKLDNRLKKVMASDDTNIHVLRCATSLGKTYRIVDVDDGGRNLLCFPTHRLKRQAYGDRQVKHTAIMTPQLPTFDSPTINIRLSRLYTLGFGKLAYKYLCRVRDNAAMEFSREDTLTAERYLDKKAEVKATKKTIFTTHEAATFSHADQSNIETVIYDESPLDCIAKQGSIKISDLMKLAADSGEKMFGFKSGQTLLDLANWLTSELKDGGVGQLPPDFNIDVQKRAGAYVQIEGITSNIVDFLEADYLYREGDTVHFIEQNFFPNDKKIIILSASANLPLMRAIWGSRVKDYNLSDIRPKGKGMVIQHLGRSYSRSSIRSASPERLQRIAGDEPVLTFMSEKDKFENAHPDYHFGNTEGYNSLSGRDIKVIGTPHIHQSRYILLSLLAGVPIAHPSNREFRKTNVEFNGMQFTFNTFINNKALQQIQLAEIHGQLLQAVGRGRHLREDCTVTVYSNFPLRVAAPNFIY